MEAKLVTVTVGSVNPIRNHTFALDISLGQHLGALFSQRVVTTLCLLGRRGLLIFRLAPLGTIRVAAGRC